MNSECSAKIRGGVIRNYLVLLEGGESPTTHREEGNPRVLKGL